MKKFIKEASKISKISDIEQFLLKNKNIISSYDETVILYDKILERSNIEDNFKKIREYIFQRYLEQEIESNKKKMKSIKIDGKFIGKIFDDKGKEVDDKRFLLPQDAQRWCDRQLYELPHHRAEVHKNGEVWESINRNDSFYRIGHVRGGPKVKVIKTSMSNKMRCKNTIVKASRG